jgi:glutathione S-transferase
VRAWEHLATEVITPLARLGFIGKAKALGLQPLGDHFAAKYYWSEAEEARGDRILPTVLPELARAVEKTPYLVGNALTRADVTMASMLIPVIGAPSNDLFVLDDPMRAMFGIPMGQESALQPLHRWRDGTYRRHRGGQVTPAAA